jgi:hypothetical protein
MQVARQASLASESRISRGISPFLRYVSPTTGHLATFGANVAMSESGVVQDARARLGEINHVDIEMQSSPLRWVLSSGKRVGWARENFELAA